MANKKISFSGEEKELDEIMSWYDDQNQALFDFRSKIIAASLSSAITQNDKFTDFSIEEINDYFDQSKEELEHLVCFNLISATEAKLRVDYNQKSTEKHKTEIARTFREIYILKQVHADLKSDIIESWKNVFHKQKNCFEDFNGALNYRHWLAHGRYWTRKFGRNYNVENTYDITEAVFDIVSNN